MPDLFSIVNELVVDVCKTHDGPLDILKSKPDNNHISLVDSSMSFFHGGSLHIDSLKGFDNAVAHIISLNVGPNTANPTLTEHNSRMIKFLVRLFLLYTSCRQACTETKSKCTMTDIERQTSYIKSLRIHCWNEKHVNTVNFTVIFDHKITVHYEKIGDILGLQKTKTLCDSTSISKFYSELKDLLKETAGNTMSGLASQEEDITAWHALSRLLDMFLTVHQKYVFDDGHVRLN